MKIYTSIFFLTITLMTMGLGCTRDPHDEFVLHERRRGVVLNQGRKPEDCGQRNPKKMLPFFEITNPRIVIGDSILIDASCTVGRIAELSWDFEFEAWPEATPPEERFETPILIDHWDLRVARDYDNGDYDLNNFGPFFQVYTPTQSGTLTARLKTKDQRGQEQTVIHTYVVLEPTLSKTDELRSNFYIINTFANAVFPQGTLETPVYLNPHMRNDYSAIPAVHNAQAIIYDWSLVSRDRDGDATLKILTDNLVSRTGKSESVLPKDPMGISLSDAFDHPEDQLRVSLDVKDNRGAGNYFGQYFYAPEMDSTPTFRPQLTVLPIQFPDSAGIQPSHFVTNIVLPRAPEQLVVQQGGYLFMQNVSILPIPFRKNKDRPDFDRSVFNSEAYDMAGKVHIEFDRGNGIFESVLRKDNDQFLREKGFTLPDQVLTYADYYKELFVRKIYTVDSPPGSYVARMRITYTPAGQSDTQARDERIVEVPYTVVAKTAEPFVPRVTANTRDIHADEQVMFDAAASTGNVDRYDWVIRDMNNGREIFSQTSDPTSGGTTIVENGSAPRVSYEKISTVLAYRFRVPGTYRVTMTTYRDPDLRSEYAEVDVVVRERRVEYRGQLSEIRLAIYPAGVTRLGGGHVDQPSYANDRIVFAIPNLDETAGKVEWDFESDGTVDTSCDVQIIDGGYVTCNTVSKTPPHRVTGEVTATVWVSERGGRGRVKMQKTYQVFAQDRIMAGQRDGTP